MHEQNQPTDKMKHSLPFLHTTLAQPQWQAQQEAHHSRFASRLETYVQRRSQQHKDPVMDFLFEYYAFRPATLLRWSPGFGTLLEGSTAQSFLQSPKFQASPHGVFLPPIRLTPKRLHSTTWIRNLLQDTHQRNPSFGCFGLHEWAMVYRSKSIRHEQLPLRLSTDAIASFVESRAISCTHYDAFRFFTPEARPLNRLQPNVHNMQDLEQPGCLHTNMDLYKWAYKLYPWAPSTLIGDAFELAIKARRIDMQASPYDVSSFDLPPIPIETPQGRETYQQRQRELSESAAPIRLRLRQAYDHILAFAQTKQPHA